ncbi:MAG: M48 family metalloprotease [Gammaproteobacteria bacterium]|nr:M48 family metalloprotease [Gammaproteobacteria bacterium]
MSKTKFILLMFLCSVVVQTVYSSQRNDARARFSEVTKTEADQTADIKEEIKVGRKIAATILGQYPLYDKQDINDYISRVGHSLTINYGREELEYYFAILDTDEVNAYASPGGYIFVTRGLMQQLRDESELAAVLAHEIIHVDKKHIVKALNIQGYADSEQRGVVTFIGGIAVSARVAFNQAVESAIHVLFSEGLQQEDEFESDTLALQILYQVGYDPFALERVLDRVSNLDNHETAVVRKTHPSFKERIEKITNDYPQLGITSGHGVKGRIRFKDRTSGLT